MKISTYVSGVLLHRTEALYELGMKNPSKYGDLAIGVILNKLSRAENIACGESCSKQDKVCRKIEKYNGLLSKLELVSNKNIKVVSREFLNRERELCNPVVQCDVILNNANEELKDKMFSLSKFVIAKINDSDACCSKNKRPCVSAYSLEHLIKSHPLFKSQRDKLDVISSSSLYLEDLIKSNPVFKTLSQEALI